MALLQVNFFSDALKRTVPMQVILPADKIGPNGPVPVPEPGYKTLYLLHGLHGDAGSWLQYSNIARYAYAPQTGMATIRIDVNQELRTVEISFLDAGIPYNPLTHEDPVSGLTCKERKEGGFGIYIVKKSMDDIRYEYADGYNVTTIVKEYQGYE